MSISSVRDTLSLVVLISLVLITAGAFWLIWNNRGSEKIVTAVLPIAVGALLGIYLAVFVFGGEQPISSKFPTTFFYRQGDRVPLALRGRPIISSVFDVETALKQNPALLKIDQHLLYHHLLQRSILELFTFVYRGNWEIEIIKINYPHGQEVRYQPAPGSTVNSQILTKPDFDKLLKGNFFPDVASRFERLALPPKTEIEVKLPIPNQNGEIRLQNPFCDVLIRTQFAGGYRGLGMYGKMENIPKETDDEYWTGNYLILVDAKFTKWLIGNPKMPKYKAWVQQLINELRETFDEERIWASYKENYFLWKQLPPIPPKHPTR